jgi:hypothetical protein
MKWMRSFEKSSIKIIEQSYEVKHNSNKRMLIYNEEGIMVNTKPYVLPLSVVALAKGLVNKNLAA